MVSIGSRNVSSCAGEGRLISDCDVIIDQPGSSAAQDVGACKLLKMKLLQ